MTNILKYASDRFTSFLLFFLAVIFVLTFQEVSAQSPLESRIDSLIQKLSVTENTKGKIDLLLFISHEFTDKLSDPIQGKIYARKAMSLADEIEDLNRFSRGHQKLTLAFRLSANYDSALHYGMKRVNFLEGKEGEKGVSEGVLLNVRTELIESFMNLAFSYQDLQDFSRAMEMYDRADLVKGRIEESTPPEKIPHISFATLLYNRANLYYQAGDPLKAMAFLELAKEENKVRPSVEMEITQTLLEMRIYNDLRQFGKVISTNLFLLKEYEDIIVKRQKVEAYKEIAEAYREMNQVDSTVFYGTKMMDVALSTDNMSLIYFAYTFMYETYEKLENYKEALKYHRGVQAYGLAIQNESNQREIGQLETKFKYEKQLAAERLSYENEIDKQKERNRAVMVGGVVLFFMFIVVLWNLRLLRKSKKLKSIENEKLIAEQTLKAREMEFFKDQSQKQHEIDTLKKERLNNLLDYKKRQLATSTIARENLSNQVRKVHEKLLELRKNTNGSEIEEEIAEAIKLIKTTLNTEGEWTTFQKHFESVHPKFFSNLRGRAQSLTENELKHCAYVKMQLSNKEVATMSGISPDSVKVARRRIKKKLDLQNEESLSAFINNLTEEMEAEPLMNAK